MAKIAYLECPTGIAGDMCLGALVHAGVPLEYLQSQLARLSISEEYSLWAEPRLHNGQRATKVHVDLKQGDGLTAEGVDLNPTFGHHHNHYHDGSGHHHDGDGHHHGKTDEPAIAHPSSIRHLPEIEQLITAAHLPKRVEAWSLAIFRRLAEAEGAVHGIPPEAVHFHEVGATDAIVDIVGTCLGLDWLNIDTIYCSPLPTGGGTVQTAHGLLPVPTPAVLQLWEMRQVPIYSNGIERELVTPTGAAIATTLATEFGPPPPMTLKRVGLGAGGRRLPLPNILRLWIGESLGAAQHTAQTTHAHPSTVDLHPPASTSVAVLETQLDDLSPQGIGYVFDALFAVGALDVFTQAIGMKKSRPGILLTVICRSEHIQMCEQVLFRETTTLGIRRTLQHRTALAREFHTVQTPHGPVTVKVAYWQGAIANVHPEYEDCAAIARKLQIPWLEVQRSALQSWYGQQEKQDRLTVPAANETNA